MGLLGADHSITIILMILKALKVTGGCMVVATWLGVSTVSVYADGPDDNNPDKVRPVPPVGITAPVELE